MVLHYLLASSSLHPSCSATLPSLLGSACSCKHCFFHLEHFLTQPHSLSCFVFLLKYYLWERTFLRISLEPLTLLFLHGLCHYPQFLFYSICSVSFRHASLPFFRATISVCMVAAVAGPALEGKGRKSSQEHRLLHSRSSEKKLVTEPLQSLERCEVQCFWANMGLPSLLLDKERTYLMDSLWSSSTIDLKNWKTIYKICKISHYQIAVNNTHYKDKYYQVLLLFLSFCLIVHKQTVVF